jgi:hypothetical protein
VNQKCRERKTVDVKANTSGTVCEISGDYKYDSNETMEKLTGL